MADTTFPGSTTFAGGREHGAIGDYALIGNGRSAALVSRRGSIDFLCWPRFESGAIFASILDTERGGSFSIRPVSPSQGVRRYIVGTNVLETRFTTPDGAFTVTDLMTVSRNRNDPGGPEPDHELIRRIHCDEGVVEAEVTYEPRPDFGRQKITLKDAGAFGVRCSVGAKLLTLRSEAPLAVGEGAGRARLRLRRGETVRLSLTWNEAGPGVLPPLGRAVDERIEDACAWWRRWIARLSYEGPHRGWVERSALAVKLMAFAPSGALVAAPTTSLPERLGADLNWDYRFCWLRDAAFTARALFDLGYEEDAEAFCSWVLHTTRLTRPALQVLYDVYGRPPKAERVLEGFRGYRGSRPVRLGNAAAEQRQLDIHGEVVDAAARLASHCGGLDRETRTMLRQLGDYVAAHWRLPDAGIWEGREPPAHHTHSRVLSWVALDRLVALHEAECLTNVPVDRWRAERAAIAEEVQRRGFNARIGSYTQHLDGDEVDASALLFGWYGFSPPGGDRMRSTHALIRKRLGAGPGLLYRSEHHRRSGEGAFGICSFWEVETLARGAGSFEEAQDAFVRACSFANDVGLFAEEIDPRSGDALGNFPQAYTHVGAINAALSLAERASSTQATRGGAPVPESVEARP